MARGTIRKITTPNRRETRWEARYAGYDRTGTRRQFRRRFATRAAAERWLAEFEAKRYTDGISISPTMTLAEYAAVWHERMARTWAPSTTRHRLSNWRRNLEPALGHRKIADITRADCQRLVDELVRAGQKPNSIVTAMAHLTAMLHAAVEDEVITHNRAAGLRLPRPRPTPPVTWTAAQARAFITGTAGTQAGRVGHVMLATGARVGEVLALRWREVDLDRGQLRIVATMQLTIDGELDIADTTKTASSRRTIPLAPSLVDVLAEHRATQAAVFAERGIRNRRDLVFPSAIGERLHPGTLRYQLIEQMRRLELPVLTPHGFRHTAATLLLEAGVPAKVVQEMLGHKTISMTLDTYSHVTTGMRQQAVEVLDRLTTSDEPPQIEG